MKVNKIKLQLIKPYWRNPRINDGVLESLKESIIKFGFKVPLVLDKNNVIITGHSRYKVLLQLKGNMQEYIDTIENQISSSEDVEYVEGLKVRLEEFSDIHKGVARVVIAKDLSEEQAKEFRVSDNKISEKAEWDEDLLRSELNEIGVPVGFLQEEVDLLLREDNYSFEEYSQNDIDDVSDKMEGKFVNDSINRHNNYFTVICPHCAEEFSIDKSRIK